MPFSAVSSKSLATQFISWEPLPTSDPRRPYNEAAHAGDYNINYLPYQGGGDPDRRAASQPVTVTGEVNGKSELVVKFEAGTSLVALEQSVKMTLT